MEGFHHSKSRPAYIQLILPIMTAESFTFRHDADSQQIQSVRVLQLFDNHVNVIRDFLYKNTIKTSIFL